MTKENYFSNQMANLSDDELKMYLEHRSEFQEEAVLAAIWELKKRNITAENIEQIELQITNKQVLTGAKNFTNDPNAPELYTTRFMTIFGVLFSVFAGGILMAMNFSRLGDKRMAWIVGLSGFLYSILQATITTQMKINSGLILLLSFLGMFLLENLFWKRNFPVDLKFRKRSILWPLLTGILIYAPFIYAIILSGGM